MRQELLPMEHLRAANKLRRCKGEMMMTDLCVLIGFWAMILAPSVVAMQATRDVSLGKTR